MTQLHSDMNGLTVTDILPELHEVCSKWFNIGLALKMTVADLHIMGHKFLLSPEKALQEVLASWLSRNSLSVPRLTWLALVNALRSTVVKEAQLADRLEKKYCQVLTPVPGTNDESSDFLKVASFHFYEECSVRPICHLTSSIQ